MVGASIIQVFLAREDVRVLRELSLYLTPRRTRKVIPPPWHGVGGGGLDGPPGVFDILQYFETNLPSVK